MDVSAIQAFYKRLREMCKGAPQTAACCGGERVPSSGAERPSSGRLREAQSEAELGRETSGRSPRRLRARHLPEGQSEPEQGRETSGAAATIEGHGDCVMQAFCDAAPASRSEALVRAAVGYLFSERSDVVQAMLAFTAEAGAQCARVTADANCPSCWLALFCGTSPASMTDEMVKAAVRAMAQYR